MIRVLAALSAVFLAGVAVAPALAETSDYLLGPQDRLKLRVYDFRPATGETHEWAALTGEFVVGASGNVSLPFVGDLHAAKSTTTQFATALMHELQTKIGLARAPYASVEVVQYRPFYILGAVDKPGEYMYRPGLNVLQALGLAGGMQRLNEESLLGAERDALVSRGDLRTLAAERLQLLVRQARLSAEIDGSPKIAYPSDIEAHAGDPEIARARREEELLLASNRNSLNSQVAILQQTKDLFQHEVTALVTKDAALARQISLSKRELELVTSLVNKGLSVTPRQNGVEQNEAQLESLRLDVQVATLRAQQDIARADRDIVELGNKARAQALTEQNEVRARLAQLDERMDTARSLVEQAEVRAPEVVNATSEHNRAQPVFWLMRTANGVTTTMRAKEDDLVAPGDTIRVERSRPNDVATK